MEKSIHNKITAFLEEADIEYAVLEHSATSDTQDLLRELIESGENVTDFDLVKTIILCKETGNVTEYIVVPREYEVNLEAYGGTLMAENEVVAMFGRGSISPLVFFLEIDNLKIGGTRRCLYNQSHFRKKNVIFSSGINNESIKMETTTFKRLLQNESVHVLAEKYIVQQNYGGQ